ncbi:alpha/beta hydrolase [Nocardioides kribbensis]|uniref:alpha/beta hydrolase n=1 Tax=Nocardioides kribbensis TaxID=305517 RepID=UPI0032DB9346
MSRRTVRTALLTAAAAAVAAPVLAVPHSPLTAPAAAAAAQVRVDDGCLDSVPEPGSTEPVAICFTVFRPEGASRRDPVPMVVHSHGWGGSRTTDPAAFAAFTDAGYGVVSFDQRGWGESGGQAHVEDPALEGTDVRRLVRMVSRLAWVEQDGPGDPRLGAIGGSYGGGYQFVGAFEELRLRGEPVFDALAPEITWHDLGQSLAPEGVVRTAWAAALAAAALPSDALPPAVYKALVEGAATGAWPDGSLPGGEDLEADFADNGPRFHVRQGRRLDIPVLLGQGTTDSLFPLEQGLRTFRSALTQRARERSIFVGYNGGHVLPALLPRGVDVTSDPCSEKLAGGDFTALTLRFLDHALRGGRRTLEGYGRYHLATPASTCVSTGSVRATTTYDVGTVATSTALGVPVATPVAEGPITVAGTPYLTADVTAPGVGSRAFYGLAVGTSPADARLVQNNVLPLHEPTPVTGAARRIALPSVAVRVPRGQRLYLLASPVSDVFAGTGSRTPGLVVLEGTVVHLPRKHR